MTAVLPEVDVSAIQHLDFDPQLPCEVEECEPRAADWRIGFVCGCHMLICDPCEEAAQKRMAKLGDGTFPCICKEHGLIGRIRPSEIVVSKVHL